MRVPLPADAPSTSVIALRCSRQCGRYPAALMMPRMLTPPRRTRPGPGLDCGLAEVTGRHHEARSVYGVLTTRRRGASDGAHREKPT